MKKSVIITILIFLIICVNVGAIYWNFFNKNEESKQEEIVESTKKIEKPKLKIIDEESNSRPYAIMINNNIAAWPNHAGLSDAYLVYEIITEGGITRLMALFKDKNTERIGSVRSSRHYFLDYALENDAIYVHFGWSPQAQSDISTLNINNINGIYDNSFWRDKSLGVAYEHTAYTNLEILSSLAEKRQYTRETNRKILLNYSTSEVGLARIEGSIEAKQVKIPYSYSYTVNYEFDPVKRVYLRYMNDKAHTDGITKEQYTTKNIIVQKVKNYSIDSYGRQDIDNIGTGEGYYITNGYAVPIIWKKENRNSQTIYQYLNGTEITVNDGNTFIQIMPITMTPTFGMES